jgi:hypothetical protein
MRDGRESGIMNFARCLQAADLGLADEYSDYSEEGLGNWAGIIYYGYRLHCHGI